MHGSAGLKLVKEEVAELKLVNRKTVGFSAASTLLFASCLLYNLIQNGRLEYHHLVVCLCLGKKRMIMLQNLHVHNYGS